MSATSLYTDLSIYYDLMCADIDYKAQSHCVHRLHQIFGNSGKTHLDLACGTGPHVQHFTAYGYSSSGLDVNQPMLDKAQARCPQAQFFLQDMCDFKVHEPVDLITCFLYSIHYNNGIEKLKQCLVSVHKALNTNGLFCFNAVDKNRIDNGLSVSHKAQLNNEVFTFGSGWHYSGAGETQSLKLCIEKTASEEKQVWREEHIMVAFSFGELLEILKPYFEVHVFEHDYAKITSWDEASGNAIFVCIKIS